jgi:hypothetical protein
MGELIQPRVGTGIPKILFFPVLPVVIFSFQRFLDRQRDLLALRFFFG